MIMSNLKRNRAWHRYPENPVLQPFPGNPFGETICMNPSTLIHQGTLYLFYAADDAQGRRTIRLSTAPAADPASLQNHGVIVDNGEPGSFDAAWCVLPQVVEIEPGTWYLYYTGNQGHGTGLSAFAGMGLAISHDLIHWSKYSDNPVMTPANEPGAGQAAGIAGGSFLQDFDTDGSRIIRLYYTVCPSMGDDVFLDQQKRIHYAVSNDGINWTKKGGLIERNPQHDYENIAVAGPVVRKTLEQYEMWYSAIGTRWGFYSICYAESEDGIHWNRGDSYGENLQLGPFTRGLRGDCQPQTWDSQMVAYPAVINEGKRDRLFYTGNGYGEGGIGMATSQPIRAVVAGTEDGCVKLWGQTAPGCQTAYLLKHLTVGGCKCDVLQTAYGILHNGDCWIEQTYTCPDGLQTISCRIVLIHDEEGLETRLTVLNPNQERLQNISLTVDIPASFVCVWADQMPDGLSVPASQPLTICGRITIRES